MSELKLKSFEAWVEYIFDHPSAPLGKEWFWNINAPFWDELAYPQTTLKNVSRLFEQPIPILSAYSDAQLKQGLWFIVDNACSSHIIPLQDEDLPRELRARCIRSIFPLYRDLFAPKCSKHLSHLDEPGSPLNTICYMLWDVLPIYPGNLHPSLTQIALEVMEQTLTLKSDACRQGALHGLGHWQSYLSDPIAKIIDAFLQANPNLRPELRAYAEAARFGCGQ